MTKEELSAYFRELGRRGGRSRSEKKLAACKKSIKRAVAARLKRKVPDGE